MQAVKAYKYKLKTNARFVAGCSSTLGVCRELYNAALQERRDAYRINGLSINYHAQAIQLPQIKQVRKDVGEVHSQVLQDALRRVDKTFDAFFRRCRDGDTPGYPRFKPASRYDSFTYPQSGFRLEGDKLHLSKIGSCRVRLSRPIEGTIKTCAIKREADGWYVVFAVEENQSRFFPKTGDTVGVDVGIESFATLSTGEMVGNPEFLRESEGLLKTAQRRVSRRTNKRSGRRRKAVKLLQKKHQKIGRRRADFHHKTALKIVREFDAIAVEDLNVKGMVRNHHLAKSISDAGWSQFIKILTSKAESAGRVVIKVNPSYTSQDCSGCGHRNRITLATRIYRCSGCGLVIHRDHNGALNVKGRAGLSGMVPVGAV
ncbi:MAG TPA: transposase [Blastocatellia bacterium]|jgi:putative transposase|nr:transposase [Blastocatellia bacterium]